MQVAWEEKEPDLQGGGPGPILLKHLEVAWTNASGLTSIKERGGYFKNSLSR